MNHHPVTKMFPPMPEAQFASLKESIAQIGQVEPAWTYRGDLIDGVHRERACSELGLTLKTREWDGGGSLYLFVKALNKDRRHLTADQLAAVAVELAEGMTEEARHRQQEGRKKGGETAGRSRPKTADQKSIAAVDFVESLSANLRGTNSLPPDAGKSTEKAAAALGVKPRKVEEQKRVKAAAPELHEKVKNGEMTHAQAVREVRRQEKRQELEQKAAAAPPDESRWRIITGDCVAKLTVAEVGRPRLVFADPPYNIGIDYGDGEAADLLTDEQYMEWVSAWLTGCRDVLAPDGSLWVLIGDEYAAEYGVTLKRLGFTVRAWVKWYETFGVNCANNFNRCSRHLFYCVKDPKRFVFNAEAVSRPSDRQTKYGDSRADPAGKIMDDVWNDIPRLAGTFAERIPDFPTQLPLKLLERIVLCCSEPGDAVLDPFNGSGTTGAASLKHGRSYTGIEKSPRFAELATLRLKGARKYGEDERPA